MAQHASEMVGSGSPKHGSFCWTEIASTDAEKCKEFYSAVFGWKFQESKATDGPFVYHEFSTGGDYPAGGLYEISKEICGEGPLPPPHLLTYIGVDDVDENAKQAQQRGGAIIKPPSDIPNTGRFAVIQDPTGAMFATFKMQG